MKRKTIKILIAACAMLIVLSVLIIPPVGVPMLAYHMISDDEEEPYGISAEDFEKQMRYLTDKGYTAVSVKEFLDAREGKGKLPPKAVIITFDDGYADNYLAAMPIMKKYGMRGSVFIMTCEIDHEPYLTKQEIKALQENGFEIGSHTVNHVALGLSTPEEQRSESLISKQVLEKEIKQPVEVMAYPYGSYSESAIAALKASGYRGACTGETGLNTDKTDPYRLKRINIPRPRLGMTEFKLRLLRAEIYAKFE